MPKRNIAANGLSDRIITLHNEIVRRLLQPAFRSVVLVCVAGLSCGKDEQAGVQAVVPGEQQARLDTQPRQQPDRVGAVGHRIDQPFIGGDEGDSELVRQSHVTGIISTDTA